MIEKTPGKKRGAKPGTHSPEHVPGDSQRRMVEAMAAYRIPRGEIAKVIGISEPTLRRHYRSELDTGQAKLDSRITESLVRQALGAPAEYDKDRNLIRAEQRPYAPAGMFLLRQGEGNREKVDRMTREKLERQEAERRAKEIEAAAAKREAERPMLDLSDATDEELAVLERLFRRSAANAA